MWIESTILPANGSFRSRRWIPGGSSPFVPTDIAGCVMYTPASFYNPSTGTWADQSGSGNSPFQASALSRPSLVANVINSQSVVRCDPSGGAQFVNFPDFSSLTAAHFFLVFKNAVNGDGKGIYEMASPLTADDPKTYAPFSGDGNIYDAFFTTTRKNSISAPALAAGGWHLYDVASSAGDWTATLDGTQIFNTGTNTVSAPSAGAFGITPSNVGVVYAGDNAMMVLYDHKLSGTDAGNLRTYLTGIYGPF